jgi:hypothetical protein
VVYAVAVLVGSAIAPGSSRSRATRPRRLVAPSPLNAGLLLLVLCGFVLLMLPSFDRPGNLFDEGLLLAYPQRVLHGAVPHRDFLSFYGPGGPWLLAGWYELVGATQTGERVFGLGYQLVIAASLFSLCLPAGRLAALGSVGIAAALLVRFDLEALASLGAVALGLAALAVLARASEHVRRKRLRYFVAGLLISAGLLLRFDFFIALLLAPLPFLLAAGRSARLRFGLGLAVAAVVYLAHAAAVGPDRISRLVGDLFASTPGRRLPLTLGTEAGKVAVLVLAADALLVAVALLGRRSARMGPTQLRTAAALAILSLALFPHALTRLDWVHVAPAAISGLGAVPLAGALLAAPLDSRWARVTPLAVAALVLFTLFQLGSVSVDQQVHRNVDQLLGRTPHDRPAVIRVGDRSFRIPRGPEATNVRRVISASLRAQRAGARRLFVGPLDLRRSYQNDAYLYYLLGDMTPASYYMELNPRTANRRGSGLAADIAGADVLVLDSHYDRPAPHNKSQPPGPAAPNLVVRRRFERVLKAGSYSVFYRRDAPWRRTAPA